MTLGVVGLGLIGGSFAKAYHAAGEKVLAKEVDIWLFISDNSTIFITSSNIGSGLLFCYVLWLFCSYNSTRLASNNIGK